MGVRPRSRRSSWKSIPYGACKTYRVAHNQVFFFHFPNYDFKEDSKANGAVRMSHELHHVLERSNKTVIFPKRASKFFKNRELIVLGGDESILSIEMPERTNEDRAQMVCV